MSPSASPSSAAPPSPGVLGAFGATGPLEALGRHTWRCGGVVLTRVRDAAAVTAVADATDGLDVPGVRLARPLRAGGCVVFDGWAAQEHVAGSPSRDWDVVQSAAAALHTALAGVAAPGALRTSTVAEAVADRMAWGDEPLVVQRPELRLLAMLFAASVGEAPGGGQLVHDRLAESVFVPVVGAAAVIVGWPLLTRPPEHAAALVAVDAIGWYDAGDEVTSAVPEPGRAEWLARAALHRLLTADRACQPAPGDHEGPGATGRDDGDADARVASTARALGRVYDVVAGLD